MCNAQPDVMQAPSAITGVSIEHGGFVLCCVVKVTCLYSSPPTSVCYCLAVLLQPTSAPRLGQREVGRFCRNVRPAHVLAASWLLGADLVRAILPVDLAALLGQAVDETPGAVDDFSGSTSVLSPQHDGQLLRWPLVAELNHLLHAPRMLPDRQEDTGVQESRWATAAAERAARSTRRENLHPG